MPAVNLIEQHGTLTSTTLVDEPNVLVESLTITPERTKKEYKGASATKALRFTDPKISFAFSGTVANQAGLADQHVGTSIASLANFSSSRFGFDPADGVIVFEDPSATENGEDPTQLSFTAVQYPFVA
jgi:hypothetical protein